MTSFRYHFIARTICFMHSNWAESIPSPHTWLYNVTSSYSKRPTMSCRQCDSLSESQCSDFQVFKNEFECYERYASDGTTKSYTQTSQRARRRTSCCWLCSTTQSRGCSSSIEEWHRCSGFSPPTSLRENLSRFFTRRHLPSVSSPGYGHPCRLNP